MTFQKGSPELVLSDVQKAFPTRHGELNALKDISFDVREGEFVCLVGPSGCGKSTLLNLIAGLEKQDSGRILLDGRPVDGPGPDRVVVFQEGALFPWMTVEQNIDYGLKVKKIAAAQANSCDKF